MVSDDGDIPPAEVAAPSDVVQRDVDGVFVASSAASDVAADTVMVPENSVSSEPAEPTSWGEPPSEVPAEDAVPPLVVPEQPEPYRGSSGPTAGDVFDSARVSDPQRPLRAGLIASAPPVKVPQLSPTPETIEMPWRTSGDAPRPKPPRRCAAASSAVPIKRTKSSTSARLRVR